ncbi:hypothetical protein [Bradyrhizobium sp.]
MTGFTISRILNSAADGAIPAAVSVALIVVILAALAATAVTGVGLVEW